MTIPSSAGQTLLAQPRERTSALALPGERAKKGISESRGVNARQAFETR
jgi:hypothetical protein